MSGSKDNSHPSGASDSLLYMALILLFGGMAWVKLKPKLIYFLENHPLMWKMILFFVVSLPLLYIGRLIYLKRSALKRISSVTEKTDGSVFIGNSLDTNKPIYLQESFRKGHTQVIGTTSAGKTESMIFPLVIGDIEKGSGVLIIDGKADKDFLGKLYAYTVKNNRQDDFRLFSLAQPEKSWCFNPLIGGSHHEIVERAFSIFTFENEYYKNLQFKIFSNITQLILDAKRTPSFYLIRNLLLNKDELLEWLPMAKSKALRHDLISYLELSQDRREERVSGLDAQLAPFTTGELAPLFNSEQSVFTLIEALEKNQIVYFQLPTMLSQYLGERMGKMVLQCLQSAVASRQLGLNPKDKQKFFGCYLDDFQDYIYEGFGSLLNKSRSANVSMTFSHQAMGDLEKISPAFKNIVFTNTNIKAVMRCNDPETCDLFSKSFGTKTIEKTTERMEKNLIGDKKTGDGSAREAEQYLFHPNLIKTMPRGQGLLSIAHPSGVITQRVKFNMRLDLKDESVPTIKKSINEVRAPQIPTKKTTNKSIKMT